MKKFILLCIALWVIIFAVPSFMSRKIWNEVPELPLPIVADDTTEEESAVQLADNDVTVTLNYNGEIKNIPLGEYLEGVVASEMPALFPDEALKAQAVAARTYTMKKIAAPPAEEHNGAAVCNNPSHCKGYEPISAFASNWNTATEEYTKKIRRSVTETDGEILLYEGEPITAVFHSTSSGKTENAADVWGGNVPYLVSVDSYGEEASPRFEEKKTFDPEEFKKIFLNKYQNAAFDPNPENWVTDISRSEAGGVKTLKVGKVQLKGSELRTLYNLNSTNFTIYYISGKLEITCRGYGHGVGMSQYGARAMALDGKNYREILAAYYTGTELGKISQKPNQ
ncbi:MAG: stage II sporulation protein D [Ruminococcaceae bacterium]|nr:stage II sporulation protein D [Oscillospiraceae bacterium]